MAGKCDSRRHLQVSWWRKLVSYQMLEVIRRGLNFFSIKITVQSFLVKLWKLKLLRCLFYVLQYAKKNKNKQANKQQQLQTERKL